MASEEAAVSLSRPWLILTAHWLQVAVLTAAFALAYAVVVWLNATYVARATLRTPELTLAEFKRVTLATSRQRLEADIANDRASLARVETKIGELQKLSAAYPQAGRGDPRQVVSVAEGGARYLSPVTQLIGASSDAIEIRDSLR